MPGGVASFLEERQANLGLQVVLQIVVEDVDGRVIRLVAREQLLDGFLQHLVMRVAQHVQQGLIRLDHDAVVGERDESTGESIQQVLNDHILTRALQLPGSPRGTHG